MRVLLDGRLMGLSMIDAPRAKHVFDVPLVNFPYDHRLQARARPFQRSEAGPVHDALLVLDEDAEADRLLIAPLVMEAVVCNRPVEVAAHGHSQVLPKYPHP